MNNPQEEYVMMPYPGSSVPIPQKSDKADLIEKIKPEHAVEIIRHLLLGEQLINQSWVLVPALINRKLSEIGAWEISNLMLGVSSVNISISKLNDHEIKSRAFNIAKTCQIMMLTNWRKYEIKNVSQFYYVHQIVFSNTLAVLKQADAASIQELLKGTVTEQRMVQNQPREGGLSSRIKRALGMGQ